MYNLRNKTKGKREKKRGKPRRFLTIENKLMVTREEMGGGWVK